MTGMIAEKTAPVRASHGFRWDLALLREEDASEVSFLETLACRSGSDSIYAGCRMTVSSDGNVDLADDERPLVVLQDDGVSILSTWYRRATGVLLYYRTACDSDAAARVIRRGLLPCRYRVHGMAKEASVGASETGDEDVYRRLSDMVDAENMLREEALFNGTASRTLTVGEIRRAIECFAALAGCEVEIDLPAHVTEAVCYQTAATDVILLYGLLLVRQHAATRGGVCHVRTMGKRNGGRLIMELETVPYQTGEKPEETSAWRYMRSVAEENGMELNAERFDGVWKMTLACLCDPARELSGDLKAEAELL